MKLGKVRDAEDGDPLREKRRVRRSPGQATEEFAPHRLPVEPPPLLRQCPPEDGLPVVLPSFFPAGDHVGTEDGVLVEGVGNLAGKLVEFQLPLPPGQVTRQGGELQVVQETGEQPHDPPRQHRRVEGGCSGEIRQGLPEQVPDKGIGERIDAVGPYAHCFCQLHGKPALHPLALDHDHLRRQGVGQGTPQNLAELGDEVLHPVAGV